MDEIEINPSVICYTNENNGSFLIQEDFCDIVEIHTTDEAIKLIAELEKFIKWKVEQDNV